MGTSLSGLTPATTFDGLLKVGDNDPLTADLKAISDGSGNDSAIQLSTGELKVIGQATMAGLTNNTSASAILAQNSDAYTLMQVRNDGTTLINNGSYQFSQPRLISTKEVVIYQGLSVGQTTAPTAARLHIKGSGNTDTTSSLLVQNSDGVDMLNIEDDNAIIMGPNGAFMVNANSKLYTKGDGFLWRTTSGAYISTMTSAGLQIGNGSADATAKLQVKGSGATSATTSLLVQNSAGTELFKVQDDGAIDFGIAGLEMVSAVNAGSLRFTSNRHINIGQTNTDYSTFSSHTFKTWDGTAYSEIMRVTGNTDQFVGIGETTPTARLHVKGAGNDNTTTALLVQNSDGVQLVKVNNDGSTTLNGLNLQGNAYFAGYTYGPKFYIKPNGQTKIGEGSGNDDGVQLQVKGSGSTSATTSLLVQNSAGTDMLKVTDDGILDLGDTGVRGEINLGRSSDGALMGSIFANANGLAIRGNGNVNTIMVGRNTNEGVTINNATTYLGASLGVKGFGATSATTALLVQNSAGTELLKVTDDGVLTRGNVSITDGYRVKGTSSSLVLSLANDNVGAYINLFGSAHATQDPSSIKISSSKTVIQGSGNDATTTALLVQNSDGADLLKVTDDGALQINSNATERFTIADANGNASLNFRYNNIYTSGGNVLYISGNQTIISGGGSERLRTSSTGTTIKGSGTTSATTALLVQNSAGADLFKVGDGGLIDIGDANGYTIQSNLFSPKIDGYVALNRSSNRTFNIVDSGAARTYLKVQSSSTSNFADVSINTDHLFVKKEGNVAVGTSTIDASAKLQVDSTTQGFLPPRMTSGEKNAITSPAPGLMVYDTDANQMSYWNGGAWINF